MSRYGLRLSPIGLSLAFVAPLLGADAVTLARVGERQLDSNDFERRARLVAPPEWQSWGSTWAERRRRFLDEVLVAEALLDVEAARQPPSVAAPRSVTLARAVLRDEQSKASAAASKAEIQSYYEQYRQEYETPATFLIWRILVRDEKDAREIIAALARPSVADFSRLARDRSIDEATSMRAGNLGFVAADGQTEMPEVRVSKDLFEAASQVRDGQLVPVPVREGNHFAVVWRRASREARRTEWTEVLPAIEQRLVARELESAVQALLDRLRNEGLRDHHPELLAAFEPPFPAPEAAVRAEAPPLAPRPVELRPRPGDQGLR